MLGTLRFLLAALVVVAHLWQKPYWVGSYAVFVFYMISGYLMTLVMTKKYGYTPDGVLRFGVNRVLRIFPAYYLAAALSAALIVVAGPSFSTAVNKALYLPEGGELIANLTLVGLSPTTGSRLIPPAWALGVEVCFYLLIAAGLGRSRRVAGWWAAISAAVTIAMLVGGADYGTRYFSLQAASLPFSLGALLLHYRTEIGARLRGVSLGVACGLYLAVLVGPAAYRVLFGEFSGLFHPQNGFFYLNLAAGFVLLAKLVERRELPGISRGWDARLGDLSYPVYLLHWPVGLCFAYLLFESPNKGLMLLLVSMPPLLLLSYAVNRWVEAPIETLRQMLGRERRPPAPAAAEVPVERATPE